MNKMRELRDYLLPGLWAASNASGNKYTDLVIDGDNLDLETKKGRQRLLSKEEIDDGSYKRVFGPRLRELLK